MRKQEEIGEVDHVSTPQTRKHILHFKNIEELDPEVILVCYRQKMYVTQPSLRLRSFFLVNLKEHPCPLSTGNPEVV